MRQGATRTAKAAGTTCGAVLTSLAALTLLASCAGGPPPPDWQLAARAALANHQSAYLAGDTRAAGAELARVRTELGATGRPELAARAELFGCALQLASLDFDDCPGYQRYAQDAAPPERAYAAYLSGSWQGLNAALLPSVHQAVVVRGNDALASIEDPISRLVATGALLRAGGIAPSGIALAIDTASANGWRRPLLAWLGVETKRTEAAGDSAAAARLRRRIEQAGGAALPR